MAKTGSFYDKDNIPKLPIAIFHIWHEGPPPTLWRKTFSARSTQMKFSNNWSKNEKSLAIVEVLVVLCHARFIVTTRCCVSGCNNVTKKEAPAGCRSMAFLWLTRTWRQLGYGEYVGRIFLRWKIIVSALSISLRSEMCYERDFQQEFAQSIGGYKQKQQRRLKPGSLPSWNLAVHVILIVSGSSTSAASKSRPSSIYFQEREHDEVSERHDFVPSRT